HVAPMRKSVRAAAIAAMLLFVPLSAHARYDTQARPTPATTAFRSALEARDIPPATPGTAAPEADASTQPESRGDMAPGQSRADYYAWLARDPRHQAEVEA